MKDKDSTIEDIMTRNPITLGENATLVDAARAMRDEDIGAVVVTNSNGDLCGVVTDRDLVIRGLADGGDPSKMMVRDICTRDVISLTPSQTIRDAIGTMSSNAVRRIPVVDEGKVVGMVSLGDLAEVRAPTSVLGQISSAPATH